MIDAVSPVVSIRTTDGSIALWNLEAQIDGLELHAARGDLLSSSWANLVDLALLRAQMLGRVALYEHASTLAERHAETGDAYGFLSRSRTRASLHRFKEAMADLDRAVERGLSEREVEVDRASVLQAIGRYEEAFAIRSGIAESIADFDGAAGLASFYAEIGDVEPAERWFEKACQRYRSVSPFAMAQTEFQRGHMWMRQGNRERARDWFLTAWRRLPAYAQAEGHLAEIEHELGHYDAAIARLRRLAEAADDPDYSAELARVLQAAGRHEEAMEWRARAEARFEELMARHPAAFADHAARFWLSIGGDPLRALGFAKLNLQVRDTPNARSLLSDATAACGTFEASGDGPKTKGKATIYRGTRPAAVGGLA